MKKTFFILILLLSTFNISFAATRQENISKLVKSMQLESLSHEAMNSYRVEALRLHPDMNEHQIDTIYSDVFIFGEKKILESYVKAFDIFSDSDLDELVKFYSTDFGKKYIKEFIKFNNKAQLNMTNSASEINYLYINKTNQIQRNIK